MPAEWTKVNRLVSAGGQIRVRSPEAREVVAAWFQVTKDLSLILSRQTETTVVEKIKKSLVKDVAARESHVLGRLRDSNVLDAVFSILNAASDLIVLVDLPRRTLEVGMALKAPTDKKSTKARLNWLLRQISTTETADLHVRLMWPGRSEETQFSIDALLDDVEIANEGKEGLQVLSCFLFTAKRLGARFTQQTNFIKDLEAVVPSFYREVGQDLSAWHPPAAHIKTDRETAEDVSVDGLEEASEE